MEFHRFKTPHPIICGFSVRFSSPRFDNGACGILAPKGWFMRIHAHHALPLLFATSGRSRAQLRDLFPRRHLRVLPTRTRPSLFGGD